ncbi:MAG: ABC transporter ATP-binding protein, partial [Candidatus Thorarchaeota archaeon]
MHQSEVIPIYAVELENISKTFAGGVQANKNITLKIEEGEVHGLLGENGAGKSTLMNVLYGLISQDEGSITIKGEKIVLVSPNDAIVRGVGMVHQHFKLIPPLTVTENVVLGMEPTLVASNKKGRFWGLIKQLLPINFKKAADKIKQIGEENGLEIDPYAKVEDISVGLQQRVEIIKTLYREADILILDEPTSVLTPQEVDELFVTLERFKQAGKTIILITHKLREPMMLCDRISVLRDGALVGTVNTSDTSPQELAQMMVGREVVFRVAKEKASPGDVVLEIDELYAQDNRDLPAVEGISISVRAGEIFGIAGVEGNGQTELVEVIA